MRFPIRELARASLLATLLTLTVAGSAFGHALYERSDPPSGDQLATPGQIQVWFTEAVEPDFSTIEVLDDARRPVAVGETQAVPGVPRALVVSVGELPDGTYTVSWRALSAVDGHVTRGVFPLVVGAGGLSGGLDEAPAFVPGAGDVLARWLGYLAALALAGGFIFRQAVLAAAPLGADRAALLATHDRRFRRLGLAASAILVAAGLVGMASQAANAADLPFSQGFGQPLVRLLDTRLGLLWQARLGLVILIALLLWRARGGARWWGGLLASGALLAAISLTSHAAAVPGGTWLVVTLDWLHQVAAAAWVGGLFSFALIVPSVLRPLESALQAQTLAALVPRFSALAIGAVVVLALTGAFQAWLYVTSWAALATFYGGSLILKLVLLVPALLLGAANLLLARPRLARAAADRGRALAASVPRLVRRFQRAVAAEALLGVGILLATAVLTASEPARETYARQPRPIELAGVAEDVGVRVRIAPGRPGANSFEVRLDGAQGQPLPEIQRVTLRFTYLEQELGSGNLILERREDGSYGAVGSNLSTDGHWQIETLIRPRGRDDVRTGFRVRVTSPELAGQPPSLDALAARLASPSQGGAAALVVLGLALAVWISRRRQIRRPERVALYAASFAVAVIGGVLFSRGPGAPATAHHGDEHRDAGSRRNPFAPDAASLARGQRVYEQNCVACHGATGRGDGPLAAGLRPRPADLRSHMAAGHTDGELYRTLADGVPGTAMPPFEGQLTEADRWHVINYIRTFAGQPE